MSEYDPEELSSKSPAELHARRQEIIQELGKYPRLDDAPTAILQELSFIFGVLRRHVQSGGPPREAKASKRSPVVKTSIADTLRMLMPKNAADDLSR